MALGVNIISNFDARGIEKAVAEFSKLEGIGEKAQFALKKAALPAAAALAALGAAATLATKAAIEDQAEQEKLAFTLRQVAGASDETIAATEEFFAAQMKTTTFTDSQMRPAFEALMRTTQDVGKSQEALRLAMDIAAGTGQDLTTVSQALARAQTGNYRALMMLSPMLKDNIREGQSLDEIYTELTQTFGGAAETMGKTTAGQMAILKNQVGELQESFGQALLPAVNAMLPVLTSLVNLIAENQTLFMGLAAFVATFASAILVANAALKIHAIVTALAALKLQLFGVALTATGIGAIVVAVGLLIAGFVMLVHKTGGVTNAFKAMGNFVIGIFEELVNGWIRLVNLFIKGLNALTSPLRALGINIGEIGPISEVSFGRMEYAANKAKEATVGAVGAVSLLNNTAAGFDIRPLMKFELGIKKEGAARLASANALEEYNKRVNDQMKGTGGATTAVKTAKEQLQDYTAALRGNYDAQRSLTAASNARVAAQGALDKAITNTARAQEFFNTVTRGFAKDSREAIDAQSKYAASQRRLRDATVQQRDAVRDLEAAEKKLRDLRAITADPEDVAEAERKLTRSKFSVEEANFAVADAEAALAKLRQDPTASPTEIRRAEIRLAESKLSVVEAVNGVKTAEQQLASEINRKATAEQIADAERDLERAKRAVEDSTDAVRDATMEQAVAQAFMNEVLNGATEGSDAYKAALDALNQAKEEEANERRNVASALLDEAKATLALRDAIIELNKVSKVTPSSVVSRGQDLLAGVSTANPALAALNAVAASGTSNVAPINVTVNTGIGGDGQAVAREVIDVLKSYERQNGYIPLVTQSVAFE